MFIWENSFSEMILTLDISFDVSDHIYNPRFDSISEAALQFKHELDVENILKRTANCSKYLHTLQDVIFPEKGQ